MVAREIAPMPLAIPSSQRLNPLVTAEFRFDRRNMVIALVLFGLLTAVGYAHWTGVTSIFGVEIGHIRQLDEAALFGAAACVALFWKLGTDNGAVLTISPKGFSDTRWTRQMIPWEAVTAIVHRKVHGNTYLVVQIVPEKLDELRLARGAKFMRPVNRLLGVDGFIVATKYLDEPAEDIEALFEHQFEAARLRRMGGGALRTSLNPAWGAAERRTLGKVA